MLWGMGFEHREGSENKIENGIDVVRRVYRAVCLKREEREKTKATLY